MLPCQAEVEIVSGPHAGRKGRVVSVPWLGNLWHTWVCVNVPGSVEVHESFKTEIHRDREWVTVRSRDVRWQSLADALRNSIREAEQDSCFSGCSGLTRIALLMAIYRAKIRLRRLEGGDGRTR